MRVTLEGKFPPPSDSLPPGEGGLLGYLANDRTGFEFWELDIWICLEFRDWHLEFPRILSPAGIATPLARNDIKNCLNVACLSEREQHHLAQNPTHSSLSFDSSLGRGLGRYSSSLRLQLLKN